MNSLEDKIENLNLSKNINKILKENNIVYIKDLWNLTRKQLKAFKLKDNEIKDIIISLQLQGLDLNKRIYD
jgi:DNA-directed RNA polymerase alpha subunit